ncbi:MAG: hypothetical protein LBT98_02710 [Puniceicoccales bacterium]|jgi:hypothetical protein|nr:hypothetical protein [Puniceicoccales bacterium]
MNVSASDAFEIGLYFKLLPSTTSTVTEPNLVASTQTDAGGGATSSVLDEKGMGENGNWIRLCYVAGIAVGVLLGLMTTGIYFGLIPFLRSAWEDVRTPI